MLDNGKGKRPSTCPFESAKVHLDVSTPAPGFLSLPAIAMREGWKPPMELSDKHPSLPMNVMFYLEIPKYLSFLCSSLLPNQYLLFTFAGSL